MQIKFHHMFLQKSPKLVKYYSENFIKNLYPLNISPCRATEFPEELNISWLTYQAFYNL